MELFKKNFFLNKCKTISLSIFISFSSNKFSICAQFLNIHNNSIQIFIPLYCKDFFDVLKFDVKTNSHIIIRGDNGNICLSKKSFKCLKFQKYKINSYITFLSNIFAKVKRISNFIINVFIYFHSYDSVEKNLFILSFIHREAQTIFPNSLFLIEEILIYFKFFEKVSQKKLLFFSPYKYL